MLVKANQKSALCFRWIGNSLPPSMCLSCLKCLRQMAQAGQRGRWGRSLRLGLLGQGFPLGLLHQLGLRGQLAQALPLAPFHPLGRSGRLE
jgi:hypothetical protein